MTRASARNPFTVRDFRLLWIGEFISALGDQFALIARTRPHGERARGSVFDDLRAAFRYVGSVPGLRAVILMSLGANFFIVGPFEVGLPVIAYQRLPEGAAAFGVLLSAFGGGSLLGLVLAAVLPPPRPAHFALIVLGSVGLAGVGLAILPSVQTTLAAAVVIALSGLSLGFGNLHGITWVQARIAPELMGRVMSVLMLGSVGLIPVSMVIAGAAVQLSLDLMLVLAGAGIALLTVGSLLVPSVRHLGHYPRYQAPAAEAGGTEPAGERAPGEGALGDVEGRPRDPARSPA